MDVTISLNKAFIDEKQDKYSPKEKTKSKLRKVGLIPNNALCLFKADVFEIQRRYKQMYIPSSFYEAHIRWVEDFPINAQFTLDKPCLFHIMNKNVEPPVENEVSSKVSDADYSYSAKVMLISIPAMDDIYRKCCSVIPDKLHEQNHDERILHHLSTQIHFLTGVNGAHKIPIGGPWSPNLDGPDPENNPLVLIRTAIRTCKSLTGINLADCKKWFRFVEIRYRREGTTKKDRVVPSKIEKVVIFLPDIWNCIPNKQEYDELRRFYMTSLCMEELDSILKADQNLREISISPIEQEPQETPKTFVTSEFDESDPMNANILNSDDIFISFCGNIKGNDIQGTDEIEREQLEKLYSLPDTPRIIVHPSRDANSGNFNCVLMSLLDLLSYNLDDTTEYSFEISLFAELFNEMLMRDFGLNIYNWLCKLSENEDITHSCNNVEVAIAYHDDKGQDSFTTDCNNLVTNNPYLLLSFEYFDLLHYGYMSQKEIKGLLYALGLNLSKAQVRKLLSRVRIKDYLYYRKLMCAPRNKNKPLSELLCLIQNSVPDNNKNMPHNDNDNNMPYSGNNIPTNVNNTPTIEKPVYKRKLPDQSEFRPMCKKLELPSNMQNGLVTYNDDLKNTEKLKSQLENYEETLGITQKRLVELECEIITLTNDKMYAQENIKDLKEAVFNYKMKLCHSEEAMRLATEKCYRYHFALQEIHGTIRKLKKQKEFKEQLHF